MVLCDDQGKIIYDDEDYTGRLERGLESLKPLMEAGSPVPFTADQLAEMRKAPMLALDSFAGMA